MTAATPVSHRSAGQVVGVRQLGTHGCGYHFLAYAQLSGSVDETFIEQLSAHLFADAVGLRKVRQPRWRAAAGLSVCHSDRSFGMITG